MRVIGAKWVARSRYADPIEVGVGFDDGEAVVILRAADFDAKVEHWERTLARDRSESLVEAVLRTGRRAKIARDAAGAVTVELDADDGWQPAELRAKVDKLEAQIAEYHEDYPIPIGTRVAAVESGRTGTVTGFRVEWDGGKAEGETFAGQVSHLIRALPPVPDAEYVGQTGTDSGLAAFAGAPVDDFSCGHTLAEGETRHAVPDPTGGLA